MWTSELFIEVMNIAWDATRDEPSKVAKAVASFVKNHRVNEENAFEVLRIMWPDAKVLVRPNGEGVTGEPDETWYDVRFPDQSQVLILATRGIGSAVEFVS